MSKGKKIKCPGCNVEISIPVSFCPQCGMSIKVYGAFVYLETGDVVVIEEQNQIIGRKNLEFVGSQKISRNHVMVSVQDDSYFIEDMGSTNGTMVNNKMLTKGDRVPLHSGDIISLAGELFSFLMTAKSDQPDDRKNTEETVII